MLNIVQRCGLRTTCKVETVTKLQRCGIRTVFRIYLGRGLPAVSQLKAMYSNDLEHNSTFVLRFAGSRLMQKRRYAAETHLASS